MHFLGVVGCCQCHWLDQDGEFDIKVFMGISVLQKYKVILSADIM